VQVPQSPVEFQTYAFGKRYAWYALFLLMLVAAFNLIDRMIVTILAGEIKTDLGLSDSEFGILYGTSFAIFYALFGIPLGRLADTWLRTRLLSIGLASWSFMTMLSGLAANMAQFSLTRIGVGMGEASSGPTATSLLADYFPRKMRSTALALYSCGIPIGLGLSLVLGGSISSQWNSWYPDGNFPLGLSGWRVAFIAVALPGLLLAIAVAFLKEPQRGVSEGLLQAVEAHPFKKSWQEFLAAIPPFTFYGFAVSGMPLRVWVRNLAMLFTLILGVILISGFINDLVTLKAGQVYAQWQGFRVTAHTVQWTALAFGIYSVISWAQSLEYRDRPAFRLILGTPVVLALIFASALFMVIVNGLMAWAPLFAVTQYHESIASVGLRFGAVAAIAGLAGTALGGVLGDRLQRKNPGGRLLVSLFAMVLPAPLAWITLSQETFNGFLLSFVFLSVVTTAWIAGILSTLQDLVLPRMRGLVYATFYLGMTIVGLGTGPYLVGLISDLTGQLGTGILALYLLTPLILLIMVFAIRGVDETGKTKIARALAAGESLPDPVAENFTRGVVH
jgi:MFS family permease